MAVEGDPAEPSGDLTRIARWLAARTGRDATAIWEWAAVERVSTGLVCASVGLPAGRRLLAAADQIAGAGAQT